MQKVDSKQILNSVRKLAPKHCDNCGYKYLPTDFKVLKALPTATIMHLSCAKCGNVYVVNAFATATGSGSQRVPLVLDIKSADEFEKFANNEPITHDDVIDMYNFLREEEDLNKVFQKPSLDGDSAS